MHLLLPLVGALVAPCTRRTAPVLMKSRGEVPVSVGQAVRVLIDTEDEQGEVWAASTVRSVDKSSGEFMVWVTEWDALDQDDPVYEAAFEEGPFSPDEEGDEWKRVQGATGSSHEAAAVEAVCAALSSFKQAGLSNEDRRSWPELEAAVEKLYEGVRARPAQPIAVDTRLLGDWELVGCTSPALAQKKGLTGLGSAPFTQLSKLHFSFTAEGRVTARETLTFFGKPVILNELRGSVGFSEDGMAMQEDYEQADLGGQANSPAFAGAEATLYDCLIATANGQTLRVGRTSPESTTFKGVFVYRKLRATELATYLDENMLPTNGGTYIGNPTWKGPVERAPQ